VIDEVYSFCESVDLPTTLAALGLDGVSDADLEKAASIACAAKETIHNELMLYNRVSSCFDQDR